MSAFNSSYRYGHDQITGRGSLYFFSYYTEGAEDKECIVLGTSFLAAIFVVSLVANLAIAAALLKYPEMRTVSNCFLLNLTMADLVFVAGIPVLIYARISGQWTFGNTICKLLPYSQVSVIDLRYRIFSFFDFSSEKISVRQSYKNFDIAQKDKTNTEHD